MLLDWLVSRTIVEAHIDLLLNDIHYVVDNREIMGLFACMKKRHGGGGGLAAVTQSEAGDGYGGAGLGCGEVVEPAAAGGSGGGGEGMDTTVKPKMLSPLERIELPTGACLGRVFARGWKGTRQRIVVGPSEGASYHVMSRTAGGDRLLGNTEKEALRRLMWRMARFSGLEIHTYAVMDNHFHILARVPAHDPFVAQFVGPGGAVRLLYSRAGTL